MDVGYTVNIAQITGVGLNAVSQASKQGTEFNNSLANAVVVEHQSPIEKFYELHQRSQISGVPTSEYNQAIKALGLAEGDSFGAIDMLRQAGYNTGMPSVGAILKYGQTNNGTGNMSFIKGGSAGFPLATEQSNSVPLTATISSNKSTNASTNTIGPPKHNFYDAAVRLAQQVTPEELQKPIDEVAQAKGSEFYESIVEKLAEYNVSNQFTKQSIESLDTLLNN